MTGDDSASSGSERDEHRERVVECIALIKAVESRLHRLGSDQQMSIGPALAETQDVIEHLAEGYGVVGDRGRLEHEAAGFDVTVERNGGDR